MNAQKLLAGKRILITRAPLQASRLAEMLEAKGAEALGLPTIAIVPPQSYAQIDAALIAIQDFDWLILTSANGVQALGERMRAVGIPLHRLAHLQVAAIGPATARAVRQLGLTVHVIPEEYVAEAVVASLKDKVAGRRVLLARAAVARDVIPEELGRRGAKVEVVEAYRTVIPTDSIGRVHAILGEGKALPHAVTFTSSSTVNNFFALLRAAEIDLPPSLRAVSIGPVTTRTLREHNWEPAVEARHYDIPGVAEACERLLASAR